MGTIGQEAEVSKRETDQQQPVNALSIEERRARRRAALEKVAGMWATREDIPADGLEYQRSMRAEWR